MRLSTVTARNLHRDRRVVGASWKRVYGDYFSDVKVLRSFTSASREILAKLPANPKVLYICSGTGLLGEHVSEQLRKMGKNPSLTLVEASKEQLDQNANPATRKIHADALLLNLREKFDLVIMRSSLDYFPSREMQVRLLKRIAAHLKHRGVFVNQCASLPTVEQRDLANRIYAASDKIGRRHFQADAEVKKLYAEAGFAARFLGHAPRLQITHRDHVQRYGLKPVEVVGIKEIIRGVPQGKRPLIKEKRAGYEMSFTFPIYAARKR